MAESDKAKANLYRSINGLISLAALLAIIWGVFLWRCRPCPSCSEYGIVKIILNCSYCENDGKVSIGKAIFFHKRP